MYSFKSLRLSLFLFFTCLIPEASFAQTNTETSLKVSSIKPSVETGTDYSPWLSDNLTSLVKNSWASINNQYVDVVLTLESKSDVSKISLYDHQGIFTSNQASIYALRGTERILLGTFDGKQYLQWVDIKPSAPVTADAIIIRKYGNNIPQKVKIYGKVSQIPSIVIFAALPAKTVGDAPFLLQASSTNTVTPITYTSSNNAVVTVANTSGSWKATVVGAGTANITASQIAGNGYTAASNVVRTLEVKAAQVAQGAATGYISIPGKIEAESYSAMSGVAKENTKDVGGSQNVGNISTNDWMDYKVNVVSGGTYVVKLRVAALESKGILEIRKSNGSVLGTVAIAKTGGWQTFTTLTSSISLDAGQQTLRFFAKSGGWNFNWFEVSGSAVDLVAVTNPVQPSTINFPALGSKKVGDASFLLQATSSNTVTPITYTSSNTAVATVSNADGSWKATLVGAGTANITAAQVAGHGYAAAANVTQSLVVEANAPATIIAPTKITPSAGAVVQGEIPYKAYWGYHKDKSTQNIEALFNGVVNETVNMGWDELLPESDIVLNFPDAMEVELQKISFYDGSGSLGAGGELQTFFIEKGTGKEIKGPLYSGSKYNVWDAHSLPTSIKISAVILRKKKGSRLPDEIKFEGKYIPYVAATFTKPTYALKNMLGINTYPSDNQDANAERQTKKVSAIQPYKVIRDYLDWRLIEHEEGEYSFQPAMSGGWKLDEIYARHKANDKQVLVCLKDMPEWMQATYPSAIRSHEAAPMPYKPEYTTVTGTSINYFNERYNADKLKPASYIKMAKAAFQLAARYGANKNVNPALMKVTSQVRWAGAPANVVKIGLNLISKIEANNEPDRHWKGRVGNQTSDEYAAYLSAFYDGHMGTLGAGVGVKQADPNMIVVAAGIASTSTAYYQGIVDWCKKNRGYLPNGKVNLCFDEINYHAYNNNVGGEQYASGTRVGVSPEKSLSPQKINNFHQVNKEFIGELPIVITETGYDWNSATQGAKVIGTKNKYEVQGDWILRTSLEYAMSGLSGLYFYQLYDDASGSATNITQYMTSGHADRVTLARRPAADYMAQVGNQFGEFLPVERLNSDPRIDKYRDNTGQTMFACWIPDEKDRRSDYTLSLGTDSAKVYTLRVGKDSLEVHKVKTVGGKLTVTVTETPIFVVAAGQPLTQVMSVAAKSTLATEMLPQLASESKMNVYPNPFTQNTTVEFVLAEAGEAVVDIYDMQGKSVRHLFAGKTESGVAQSLSLDADGLPSGVYVARLTTGKKTITKKIMLVK